MKGGAAYRAWRGGCHAWIDTRPRRSSHWVTYTMCQNEKGRVKKYSSIIKPKRVISPRIVKASHGRAETGTARWFRSSRLRRLGVEKVREAPGPMRFLGLKKGRLRSQSPFFNGLLVATRSASCCSHQRTMGDCLRAVSVHHSGAGECMRTKD